MMRFNHMELTFARGTLTPAFRKEVDDFYGSIFGWVGRDTEILGQSGHLLLLDDRATQFILLAESGKPLSSPGYDHLGLLQPTRAEVDRMLDACRTYRDHDDRVELREYEDLTGPTVTVHAFYVRFLLPIFFDVQSMEFHGDPPSPDWQWR